MFTEGIGVSERGADDPRNEDDWLVDDDLGLYVVCDGMGGHPDGEVAARVAIDAVAGSVEAERSRLVAVAQGRAGADELRAVLEAALRHACAAVWDAAEGKHMGCSCTALLMAGDLAAYGHVGHTRLYVVRGGRVHQLTRDHTLGAELGRPVEGSPHLAKVLTRALGIQPDVEVDTGPVYLRQRDHFVLCSDGAWSGKDGAERLGALLRDVDVGDVSQAILDGARRDGPRDDTTAVAVRVRGEPSRPLRAELNARALSQLLDTPLFAGMPLRQRHRVLGLGELATFDADTPLVVDGEPLDALLLVVEGSLAVSGPAGPDRVEEGELVGWSRMAGSGRARADLRARGRTTVLRIDAARFRKLAWTRPWFAVPVLLRAARLLREGEVDPV